MYFGQLLDAEEGIDHILRTIRVRGDCDNKRAVPVGY